VVWQKLGLATYLLCMLVKQHTCNNMDDSVLSLQAFLQRGSLVCRYYMSLGFISQNCDGDNGLSLTSPHFQKEVVEHKYLWVTAKTEAMSFFQLFKGQLNLKKVVYEHDLLDSGDDRKGEWRKYGYALFPPSSSMDRIEDYLDSRPILRWLSREPLS
jgi:hypothetical protein